MRRMRNAAPVLTISALALLLVALPLLYFGAYYALLNGRVEVGTMEDTDFIVWEDDTPSYRQEGEMLESFFHLANEVDKRLRPGEWKKARTEVFP